MATAAAAQMPASRTAIQKTTAGETRYEIAAGVSWYAHLTRWF